MPTREIKLESAAFLDSTQAQRLSDVPREGLRAIVDRFLACAYDEVGKAPRFLDGDDMHAIVGHLLPARFTRKDPLADRAIEVLEAYLGFLVENAVVSQAFEMRQALNHTAGEFAEAVRTGAAVHHAPHAKVKPFVHHAAKVGRNDPCPCGSQKKFKQCCARLGS